MHSWTFMARGSIAVAVGILILLRPFESVAALALVIALWALLAGLVATAHAIAPSGTPGRHWALLVPGVAGIALGIAALYSYRSASIGSRRAALRAG